MRLVYLGFFSRVFGWVLDHIFEPVFRFVSNLLNIALTWVFQEVLAPILMPVLEAVLEFAINLWVEIYSTQLYLLFSGILKLIDYLEIAFDVFIGLKDVRVGTGSQAVRGPLIDVLMQQEQVSSVFWVLTLGGLGIAMMLTIIATAKSALDFDFENKRPVTKVLTAMMKAFIQFFTVPFLVYFLLRLSAIILKGITGALTVEGSTSLGRMVFVIASLNAAKTQEYNVSSNPGADIGPLDTIRKPFYVIGKDGVSSKDYGKINEVADYFHLGEFDYLIGFIAAVFLLFTIGICLVVFIQRIFELLILYLVSPYFVCTMPLDDGEKFSRWREIFVGKCFSGFGSAIGMRLYLMVCPIIMGNNIQLAAYTTSPETEYMMKLFFLAGGAWAVYKSGSMITSLISSQAGQSEMQTANMVGGMLYGSTIGAAIGKGRGAISSLGGKMGSRLGSKAGGKGASGAGRSGLTGKGSKSGEDSQAFQGGKKKNKWEWNDIKVGALNAKRQEQKEKAYAAKAAEKAAKKQAQLAAKKGISPGAGKEAGAAKDGGLGKAAVSGASGLDDWKAKTSGLGLGEKKEDGKDEAFTGSGLKEQEGLKLEIDGLDKEKGSQAFTDSPDSAGMAEGGPEPEAGDGEKKEEEEKHKGHNIHIGSFLSRQYDEDGNMKFRMMGLGYSRNEKGQVSSICLPGLKLKRTSDDDFMIRRFSALPGVSIARAETDKGIKFSDLSLFGYGYHMREEGKEYSLGKKLVIQKGADGSRRYQVGKNVKLKDEYGDVRYQVGKINVQKDIDGSRQYQLGGTSYTKVLDKEKGVDKTFNGPINVHMATPKAGEKSRLESIQIGKVNYNRSKPVHDLRIGGKSKPKES